MRDPNSDACAVIDSVLDLDYASGTIGYTHADMIIDFIETHQLSLEWLIETHVHADHLSAAPYIQQKLVAKLELLSKLLKCSRCLAKCSMLALNFNAMVANLIFCSMRVVSTRSAACLSL